MNVLERNNVQRVRAARTARPMVFAHGFGCDQNMWRFVAPAFEADHRVILFDHVGAGGSDLSAYDARALRRRSTATPHDVVEICRELDVTDAVFVGHSVSAMIGVLAAGARARALRRAGAGRPVAALHRRRATTSAASRRADIDELLESLDSNFLGWSSAMAPVIMGNADRPELGEELTDSFCRTDPDIARAVRPRDVPVRQPRRPRAGRRRRRSCCSAATT